MFEVSTSTIREVFRMNTSGALLEEIDLGKLQVTYDAHRIYLRIRLL